MKKGLASRLSLMMFLEFFVWGAWYTTVGVYMNAHGMKDLVQWPFTMNAVAAIVSPFFLGLIADRYFATEKVLGVLHLLGGVFILFTPSLAANPTAFIAVILAYNLCYMPTLGLSNSLAFHHIVDQEKQFPKIRVFGTIGWIVAGLFVSFAGGWIVAGAIRPEQTAMPLYTTGIASLLLGLYAFSLPHTPPPGAGEKVSVRSILGVDAFRRLGSRSFYIFCLSSLLICIPLAVYYAYAQLYLVGVDMPRIAAVQTIGQASEFFFMLAMPIFFARLGVKWMLGAGMLAWAVRYGLFALGAPGSIFWMIILGIALHGICYDFFFVTGQIYVDKKSTPAIRSQAQGFLVLLTYGVGMLIGTQIAGAVYNGFLGTSPALTLGQWESFWWLPAAFAVLVLIFFLAFFRDDVSGTEDKAVGEPQFATGLSTEPAP
ncbi:MAG TPA: nucleoside permease [Rhodothermales bacterium]|nr:nucleoside permease [Rhodothermales bacterium]